MIFQLSKNSNIKIFFIIFLFLLSSLYLESFIITNHNLDKKQQTTEKRNVLSEFLATIPNQETILNGPDNEQITIAFSGFIKNIGQQSNSVIEYYYNSQSSGIAFLSSEVIYSKTPSTTFTIRFVGSNTIHPIGVIQNNHPTSFFLGTNRLTNVPSFQEVWYHNLYNNIDLRYYNTEKGLKYEFLVYPGGNPADIKMQYSSNVILQTTPTKVDIINGQVLFSDTDLLAYSTSLPFSTFKGVDNNKFSNDVSLFFKATSNSNIIGFELGNYDTNKLLVIDPLVVGFTTFIGGSKTDNSRAMAVDTVGNIYITGSTSSTDFPVNTTAFDTTQNGYTDVFITKLNSSNHEILYSTYLGGATSNDDGYAITVDISGNTYVTGVTTSTDFPVTSNAYRTGSFGGTNTDVFVTKLNSTGSGLVYSTYLGGTNNDFAYSLAVDSADNLFVLGDTLSSNFPVNTSSFDSSLGGTRDAFVAKFNSTGNGLLYCTFLGGSSNELSQSLKIDTSGNAYVTGATYSSDFPVNNTVFDNTFNGGYDIFVSKLNATGNGLIFSTFIGGSQGDQANSLFLDSNQNVYLTGFTTSNDFPVANAFDSAYHVGGTSGYDAFVLKLSNTGNSLNFSTYLGGTADEAGNSIVVDNFGNSYVTGFTYSTDFPTTSNSLQSTNNGGTDAFISEFNSTGTGLLVSSYLGGSVNDYGNALFVDSVGSIYVTGQTFSSNFTSTSSSISLSNAFISKLMFSPEIILSNPTNSYYNTHVITLDYSVADTNLDTVKIYVDGVANTSTLLPGSILNSPSDLADGIHNVTIYANNTLGLYSVKQILFTVDTTAPVVSITSPIAKTYGSNAITLSYSVSGQSFVDIYVDGTKNSSIIISGSVLPTLLADGSHNITLVGTDLAGNSALQTVLFKTDTTAPYLLITSPGNTSYSNGSVVLTYSISDYSSYTTFIYLDGASNTSLRNSGFEFNLSDGVHNITIQVIDNVGNSATKTILFTVLLIYPNPPGSSSTQPETTQSSQSITTKPSQSSTSTVTTPGFNFVESILFSVTFLFYKKFKRVIKKK